MSTLVFERGPPRDRFGLKGARAAEWLMAHGIVVPMEPNTWASSPAGGDDALFVARLGIGEFFLEDTAGGGGLRGIAPAPEAHPPGVYPVLREDTAFLLAGEASCDVLAQVCDVNFADIKLESHPVVLTLMIGVAVLVVPHAPESEPHYRIWCDPTFAPYLEAAVGTVVGDCGGRLQAISRGRE